MTCGNLKGWLGGYVEQGQPSVAFQKVREYAARRPKSAQIQEYVGEQLQISGDRAVARTFYNAAKAADPGYTRTYLALAQLDLIEGRADEARKAVSGLASTSKNIPAVLMLGDIEAEAGNYSTAVEQYRKVLKVSPGNVRALNGAAYLLAEYQKQPDEALPYAQRAAELAPDDPAVEDTAGWVFYRKGVYGTAVQYLKAAAAKSNQVAIKYHLAMAYLKAGQVQQGRETLEAALRTDSSIPEAGVAKQMFADAGRRK